MASTETQARLVIAEANKLIQFIQDGNFNNYDAIRTAVCDFIDGVDFKAQNGEIGVLGDRDIAEVYAHYLLKRGKPQDIGISLFTNVFWEEERAYCEAASRGLIAGIEKSAAEIAEPKKKGAAATGVDTASGKTVKPGDFI